MKTRNGAGTAHSAVEKTTVAQMLEMGTDLTFPDGISTKHQANYFTFDFKGNKLQLDDTVGRLYEQIKLKLYQFYNCTKEEDASADHSSSELSKQLDVGLDRSWCYAIEAIGGVHFCLH